VPVAYKQKALDLRDPPFGPRNVMVYRARGIEEVKDDLDNSELSEDTSEENTKGEEESQEMLNHGDS
jgi:hypothetical protein